MKMRTIIWVMAVLVLMAILYLGSAGLWQRSAKDRAYNAKMEQAETLLSDGRNKEAVKAIAEAVNLRRDDYQAYEHAAFLLGENGLYRESIPLLEQGIKQIHSPGMLFRSDLPTKHQSVLYYVLGYSHLKLGHLKECIASYREAIRLDKDNAHACNDLGYLYADSGTNLAEALRLTTHALDLKPNDGYIMDSVGWTYYKMGRYPDAVEHLKKAVELVPSLADLRLHLGLAYEAAGDPHAALIEYTKALSISPSNKEAQLHRQRLVTSLSKK